MMALEVAFRLAGIRGEYHREHVQQLFPRIGGPTTCALLGDLPLGTFRCQYDSNPRGYFGSNNEVDHALNSAGWRDVEHTILKPKSTFRLLGLGDSFLYGYGVHYEDIFLTQLGEILGSAQPHLSLETINTASNGSNTAHHAAVLQQRALRYDPDLVMLNFVLNDIEGDVQYQGLRAAGEMSQIETKFLQPDTLSQWSYLWSWARQRWYRMKTAKKYINETLESFSEEDPNWQACKSALQDIAATCERREIPLVIVIFPFLHNLDGDYPFQPIHDNLHRFFDREGIRYLDLRDAFGAYHGPELWVHPTDLHPNELAHGVAAKAIANYLLERGDLFDHAPAKETNVPFDEPRELQMQAAARIVQLHGALSDDGSLADVSGNPLTDEDLLLLAPYWRGLPQLTGLSLQGTKITDETLTTLGSLKNLTVLDLSATRITAVGLAHLHPLVNLQQLGLAQLDIGDDDLPMLASFRELRTLNLANTAVSDVGLVHLSALPHLEHLVLARTGVTNRAIEHLAALPNLTAVDLRGTSVDAAALEELAKLRPNLKVTK